MAETQHQKARAKLAIISRYIPKGKVIGTAQQSKFRDGADWASPPRWTKARVYRLKSLSLVAGRSTHSSTPTHPGTTVGGRKRGIISESLTISPKKDLNNYIKGA